MKNYIMMALLLLLCNAAAAQKYTVALLAKLGAAKSDASVRSVISDGTPIGSYKFHLKSEGVTGGVGVDVTGRNGSMLYGFEAGGYMDGFQAKNKDGKIDLNDPSNPLHQDEHILKRNYTLEFSGKMGWFLNENMNMYGKAGVLYSTFIERYRESGVDTKTRFPAWGGIVGAGIQKKFNTFSMGIEYDFHMYPTKTNKFKYNANVNTVKIKPVYHNLFVTLSKPL